jgi:hypothetical protein
MAVSRLDTFKLMDAATTGAANGNGTPYVGPVNGFVTVMPTGSFGGGTLQPQVSPDGGTTWVNIGGTITTGQAAVLQVSATALRVVLAGATAPAVNCWATFADWGPV